MALRWNFQFKTKADRLCQVDIYDKTYSGAVTILDQRNANAPGYPDDDPVLIEEAHSNNLLDVVRTKTGYINLRELQPDALRDMYPSTNDQCEVVITYADTVVFKGYVQAQSFANDYLGNYHKVKLPIMSYMETLIDQPLPDLLASDNGTTVTLGEIFEVAFEEYEYLVMPNISATGSDEESIHPLNIPVFVNAVFPYNDDYNYGIQEDGITPSVYSPITYGEFIEGVCNLFGFIAHDMGGTLLFTRFDYDGDYIRCDMSDAAHPDDSSVVIGNSSTEMTISNLFTPASDKNQRDAADAVQSLRINYDKVEMPFKINFDMSKYVGFDNAMRDACMEYQGRDIESENMTTQIPLPSQKIRVGGDMDGTYLHCYYETPEEDEEVDDSMMTVICPTPKRTYPLRMKMKIETPHPGLVVRAWVMSGGQYYDPYGVMESDLWVDTPVYNDYQYTDHSGDDYEYEIMVETQAKDILVKLTVLRISNLNIYKIREISFVSDGFTNSIYQDIYNKYARSTNDHVLYRFDEGSTRQEEIDQRFFLNNDAYSFQSSRYRYLRKSQPELKLIMWATTVPDHIAMYIDRLRIFSETGVWRLISYVFSPRDDEYTLYAMSGDYQTN